MDRDKTVFITNTPCNTLGKPVYKIVFKYEILYESYLYIFKCLSIEFKSQVLHPFSLQCALPKPIFPQTKIQSSYVNMIGRLALSMKELNYLLGGASVRSLSRRI